MRRVLLSLVAVLALVLLATQLLLPNYLAGRVQTRLQRDGGQVDVSLSAFPALTLLASHGGRIVITGEGQSFELGQRARRPLDRLDDFGSVRLDLRDSTAGPLVFARLTLDRSNRGDPYRLTIHGSTTPKDLAAEAGSRAGGFLGSIAGSIATDALPHDGRTRVPFDLDVTMRSDHGKPSVDDASASIAGVPTGPLAELVVGVVVRRL